MSKTIQGYCESPEPSASKSNSEIATYVTRNSRDQSLLTYSLPREQASYSRGFVRSFITGLWAMAELILLPVLIFAISRRLDLQGIGLFSLAFFCIVPIPLALTSHLILSAYLQSYVPRIIGLDLASGTLVLECPRQIDSWPLADCSWARGVTLQDTVGELLPNQAAILIRLPHDEPQLPPQVVAIPNVVDDEAWQSALVLNGVPSFHPEPATRYLKTPGLVVRSMGRGISVGLLIAMGLNALIERIAGGPFWVPSVYMTSIIASIWASGYYVMLYKNEADQRASKSLISLSCSLLFVGMGIVAATDERLNPLAFVAAVLIHVAAGLALTWLLISIVILLSRLRGSE